MAPVVVIAGEAPVSDAGFPRSRDNLIHYKQDVFDQTSIVREYCRWTSEYHPPGDSGAAVIRAVERAQTPPAGPVYLSASREALEATEYEMREGPRSIDPRPSEHDVSALADLISEADRPLIITSRLGSPPAELAVETLVAFAESAGASVVENRPMTLSFPRDHDLHLGFDPSTPLAAADLVIVAGIDVL
ncbi:thiamine pyrophosphate-binding protein [Natrinema soli]|uniref:Thiamine pyrophosphate-binding protein n=1 Tax=Natrinema soli TaxID=1930624 RepID=A0ABD5SQX7_9EURY|nr:thiamine pyrophosphate-binding protein [Natrinema soli]